MLLSASLVKDINLDTEDSAPDVPVDFNGLALFAATDATHGRELWASDGTPAGTRLVDDLSPGTSSSNPRDVSVINGVAYFSANGPNGPTLYRTDATAAGTVALFTLPQTIAFGGNGILSARGKLFFEATYNTLESTDGTAAGTTALATLGDYTVQSPNLYGTPIPGAVVVNDTLYFVGYDTTNKANLYRTDGTVGGTQALATLDSLFVGVNRPYLTNLGDTLIVVGADGVWSSDGSPQGTRQLATFPATGEEANAATLNGQVVLASGDQLWRTDGTVAGTYPITPPGFQGASRFRSLGNAKAIFAGPMASGSSSGALWVTDGTEAGTTVLNPSVNLMDDTVLNGIGYFTTRGGTQSELWSTDGTASGTVPVASLPSPATWLAPVANALYFSIDDVLHGFEPWIWDNTAAGVRLVDDINVAAFSSSPGDFTDVNGELYFTANDGVDPAPQLWKTDGTDSGTQLVDVNHVTSPYAGFEHLIDFRNRLYFFANGYLSTSDGTAAGTQPVVPAGRFGWPTNPFDPVVANGMLYFLATGAFNRRQVWQSDGTNSGTTLAATVSGVDATDADRLVVVGNNLVLDLPGVLDTISNGTVTQLATFSAPEPNSAAPIPVTVQAGHIDYVADAPSGHAALFRSDGTVQGSVMLADLGSVGPATFSSPQVVASNGSIVFFVFPDSRLGPQLWAWDGTTTGTSLVRQFVTSPTTAGTLTEFDGEVYFLAFDAQGTRLWKTDGTSAGTVPLTDTAALIPGMIVAGGALFFDEVNASGQWQLLSTDGTTAGTQSVYQMNAPYRGSLFDPLPFTISGNNLFFPADDGVHGRELWKTTLSGSVSGSVFNDTNHNGVPNPSEPGMPGVTVYLDANANGQPDPDEITATTDANGNYLFPDVPGGITYTLREVPPAGWRQTAPLPAADTESVIAGRTEVAPAFGVVQISSVPMDFNYLLTLAQHYDQQGTFATGDLNNDGKVNFDDLLLLAQNFGRALPSVAAAGPVADLRLVHASRPTPRARRPGL